MPTEKELAFRLILFYNSLADYLEKYLENPYERTLSEVLRNNNKVLASLFHRIFEDFEDSKPTITTKTKYVN